MKDIVSTFLYSVRFARYNTRCIYFKYNLIFFNSFHTVLQPVNGYKIADKIILANKELFESDPSSSAILETCPSTTSTVIVNDTIDDKIPHSSRENSISEGQRRVHFRPDLEDFEPEFITDDDDDDNDDDDEEDAGNDSVSDDDVINTQVEAIVEAEIHKEDIKEVNAMMKSNENIADTTMSVSEPDFEEIEEICEVIEDFSLADVPTTTITTTTISKKVKQFPDNDDTSRSGIDHECTNNESKQNNNKSPVNSTSSSTRITNAQYENSRQSSVSSDESENSQLSTVIPNDFHHYHHHHPDATSPCISRNSSAAAANRDSKVLKIQLNFKPCCEYKYLENDRLPRYCGYLSQYGLSKEQLELREARRERHHRRKYQHMERKTEEELLKTQVNEEAFARWLEIKMRNTRSGNKNMYDYNGGTTIKQSKKKKKQNKNN